MKQNSISQYRNDIIKRVKKDIISLIFLAVMFFMVFIYLVLSYAPLIIIITMVIIIILTKVMIIRDLYSKIYTLQDYDDFLVYQNENIQKKRK